MREEYKNKNQGITRAYIEQLYSPASSPGYPAPLPRPRSFAADAFLLVEECGRRKIAGFHQSQQRNYSRSCSAILRKSYTMLQSTGKAFALSEIIDKLSCAHLCVAI